MVFIVYTQQTLLHTANPVFVVQQDWHRLSDIGDRLYI